MATSKIDTDEFEKHVERMLADVFPRLERTAREMTRNLSDRVRAHVNPTGGTPGRRVEGSRIGSRSGALWEALEEGGKGNLTEYAIDAGGLSITFGVDDRLVPYARVHEHGATIRAKRAGALTIPLSQAAVDALEAVGGNIRALNLLLIPSRSGDGALLAKKQGESIIPLFTLKKSVDIPARPFFGLGFYDFTQGDLESAKEEIADDLRDAWNHS